jgi:hypothetical protein
MDNHIKPKIRYLQGLEQSRRTDPKASPRTPQHEQDANSCTDALRFVCDQNKFNKLRSKVFKDVLSAGWGGYEVTVEQRPGRPNPVVIIRRCPWDRMGWDPYSSDDMYEDANYRFLVLWMDREEAIAKYGNEAGQVFDETVSFGRAGGSFDDKPRTTTWVSYNKRWRVRVVQLYFKHSGRTRFALPSSRRAACSTMARRRGWMSSSSLKIPMHGALPTLTVTTTDMVKSAT